MTTATPAVSKPLGLIVFGGGRLVRMAAIACLAFPVLGHATTVRLQTSLGNVDIELFDAAAPLTVANFLKYVGAYNGSFIHRSVPTFIIQGGGYTFDDTSGVKQIPAGPPVANEFSASRSNLRGTIAMAKLPNDPNSATKEWFINLADNALNLDIQNGGFTVFGQVTVDGMAVMDAIAALEVRNAGGAFEHLPLTSIPSGQTIQMANLVMVSSALVLPATSDCLFDWAEHTYPQYFSPAGAVSAEYSPYTYRYYSGTGNYLATSSADNHVWVLGPMFGSEPLDVGPVASFLGTSGCQ